MPLQDYDKIRLRDEFQGTLGDTDAIQAHRKRTTGKDEVAQHIVDNVINKGRWPVNMVDLADDTDYSRQHVSQVVDDYFNGVDDTTDEGFETETVFVKEGDVTNEVTIRVPSDAHKSSYVRGYLAALG